MMSIIHIHSDYAIVTLLCVLDMLYINLNGNNNSHSG